MKLASTLVVKKTMKDGEGNQVTFRLKYNISGFALRDRLEFKCWKPIHAARETAKKVQAKITGKAYCKEKPNFPNYLWRKEKIFVEKALKTYDSKTWACAEACSSFNASYHIGFHEAIKQGGYLFQTSGIIPLTALNQFIWEGQTIRLQGKRLRQAATIAVELAETCSKYNSFWAREQLECVPRALERFIELAGKKAGIGPEITFVQGVLNAGMPVHDNRYADEAYEVLWKDEGTDGIMKCRELILKIRNPEIRREAIEKCNEYWTMNWFSVRFAPVLFPGDFLHKALANDPMPKN